MSANDKDTQLIWEAYNVNNEDHYLDGNDEGPHDQVSLMNVAATRIEKMVTNGASVEDAAKTVIGYLKSNRNHPDYADANVDGVIEYIRDSIVIELERDKVDSPRDRDETDILDDII